MHQTFYIDIDEEISSVIDRLNKSMSVDNYFVVPKRALFLQSIVNLKILKREADKMRKRVIIVTQDEIGASMAQRSDVEVRESLDGLEPYQIKPKNSELENKEQPIRALIKSHDSRTLDKQTRLSGVGTTEFFSSEEDIHEKRSKRNSKKDAKVKSKKIEDKKKPPIKEVHQNHGRAKVKLDPKKEEALEKIFGEIPRHRNEEKTKHGGFKKIKNIFITFVCLCFVVFVGSLAYLFLPSSKIIVTPNTTIKKLDLDVLSSVASSLDDKNIPLRVIQEDQQVSLSFDLSSQTTVTGQKAQGSVVIYNEYSDAPQTLMATTRLQSADGKIFRIAKTVVVPGYSNVGGQIKPGNVRADIVADQAGSDYNIDPTDFKIPGFEGGPKYDKFHATSTESMQGGTTSDTQAGVGVVSQDDIDSAKQKTENAFKEKINQDIANSLKPGEIALPQAQNIIVSKSSASSKVGNKTASFNYEVQGSVIALVFSENDIKKLILQNMKDNSQNDSSANITKIDYGSLDTNFNDPTIAFKVHAEITSTPLIDSEQLKNGLLGKGEDQLADEMRKYPAIKNANIEFKPSFINHVSQYPQRIEVEILQNSK